MISLKKIAFIFVFVTFGLLTGCAVEGGYVGPGYVYAPAPYYYYQPYPYYYHAHYYYGYRHYRGWHHRWHRRYWYN